MSNAGVWGCGIYAITSPSGGMYVGSAASFRNRWSHHRRLLRKGSHHSPALQSAFNKYGEDQMVFSKLVVCAKQDLTRYEQIAMDALQPRYNVLKFARSPLGVKHSDETKAKISASMVGKSRPPEVMEALRQANIGRRPSTETIRRLSEANSGKKRSEEQVANMRAAQAGRGPSPATIEKARLANTGRSLSPEHAAKARVAALGSKKSQESIARSSAAAKTFCENNRQLVLDRVRAVHCGRKRSDETRRRISEARRVSHARKAAGNGS